MSSYQCVCCGLTVNVEMKPLGGDRRCPSCYEADMLLPVRPSNPARPKPSQKPTPSPAKKTRKKVGKKPSS
jgi:DNA-directed RNA polymerase subunit RPC12/RpoP